MDNTNDPKVDENAVNPVVDSTVVPGTTGEVNTEVGQTPVGTPEAPVVGEVNPGMNPVGGVNPTAPVAPEAPVVGSVETPVVNEGEVAPAAGDVTEEEHKEDGQPV